MKSVYKEEQSLLSSNAARIQKIRCCGIVPRWNERDKNSTKIGTLTETKIWKKTVLSDKTIKNIFNM